MADKRYLITQSLLAAWDYVFNCADGYEAEAMDEFRAKLNREEVPSGPYAQAGINFENAVYAEAAGLPHPDYPDWETGIKAVADRVRGAAVQVKCKRELDACDMKFLVYGKLDALRAGEIIDVKYSHKPLSSYDAYGKYLDSPQHPFYFFIVPEAYVFTYVLSDGHDVYEETYRRQDTRPAEEIIVEFINSLKAWGLLDVYCEKWEAL